jgi:hypothetical protein
MTHPSPEQTLLQMLLGAMVSRALTYAAEVQVADCLKERPQSAAAIAQTLGLHEDATYRMMRALSAVGVFAELPGKEFALTPLSDPLRTDAPHSMQAWVAHLGFEPMYRSFAELDYTMRTGKSAFMKIYGTDIFEWLAAHPREQKTFDRAMSEASKMTAAAIAKAYDFSGIKHLVDVGGGQGRLLAVLLAHNAQLRATLFDRETVVAGAPELLEMSGVKGRVSIESGSFFERVPEGADAYILKAVLHDWDDARAANILENCRRAMSPGGRVLVCDPVLSQRRDAASAKLFDFMILCTAGGRERTTEEFTELFERVGLKLWRVIPTDSMLSIIEARAARD